MPVHDDLGTRMKEFYEQIPKTRLMRRTPVALRIDGKAFHTFTRGLKKPFDDILIKSMQDTMKYLCEHIQGCVFGYTQSDEITLILIDYKKFTSCAWFDYEVQKICSIAASMATMAFNKAFDKNATLYVFPDYYSTNNMDKQFKQADDVDSDYAEKLYKCIEKGAMFDCRCFNIPKEEVCNLIYWRQLDATRNSIEMVGQAHFAQNRLNGVSCNQIQDMLHETFNINWNDFPTEKKRGSACIRNEDSIWVVDHEMPILKGEDRNYVDRFIFVGEE